MTVAVLLLLSCVWVWIGYRTLRSTGYTYRKLSFFPVSVLVGSIGWTLGIFWLSHLLPTSRSIVVISCLVVIDFLFFLWRKKRSYKPQNVQKNVVQLLKQHDHWYKEVVILTLLTTLIFVLGSHAFLREEDGNLLASENTYGDMGFHVSQIQRMVTKDKLPAENAQFGRELFVYPYLADFHAATLVILGMSMRDTLLFTLTLFGISFFSILLDFYRKLSLSSNTSLLAVLLFALYGGTGFVYFLRDAGSIEGVIRLLSHPQQLLDYSRMVEMNIHWAGFLKHMVLAERSILFGLPIGVFALQLLFQQTPQQKLYPSAIIAGLFLSQMPIIHTHTVIAFAVAFPVLVVTQLVTSEVRTFPKKVLFYLLAGTTTLIGVLPLLPLFFGHLQQSTPFFQLRLGWMTAPTEDVFTFWWKNMYLWIPAMSLIAICSKPVFTRLQPWQWAGLLLLLVCNLALFSPFDWDNVKLLFWIGIFAAPALALLFQLAWKHSNFLGRPVVILLILSSFASGALGCWRELHTEHTLYSTDAQQVATFVSQRTGKNEVFLTYPDHNHPVNNLAGRPVLMGHPGFLWTQGIQYEQKLKDLTKMFEYQANTPELLQKYNISYVVTQPEDPPQIAVNRAAYTQYYSVVFENSSYTIYDIRQSKL